MSKTKIVPIEIPEHLYELAALSAEEERTDKMIVLQRWLHQGAELYVMQQVAEGRSVRVERPRSLVSVFMTSSTLGSSTTSI